MPSDDSSLVFRLPSDKATFQLDGGRELTLPLMETAGELHRLAEQIKTEGKGLYDFLEEVRRRWQEKYGLEISLGEVDMVRDILVEVHNKRKSELLSRFTAGPILPPGS